MFETDAIEALKDPQNPTVQRLSRESAELAATVDALAITSAATLQEAGRIAQRIASWKKLVETIIKPVKQAQDRAKRETLEHERTLLAMVAGPDQRLRTKMTDYELQRRREADEQRKAAAEAARKAAEDQKLNEAVQLEQLAKDTGDTHYAKAAEQVLDTPLQTFVAPPPPPAKVAGVSFSERVTVTVDDPDALWAAATRDKTLRAAFTVNEAWLRREAVQRGEAFAVPGVTRHVEVGTTVRA